jgi:hypothetical protein
MGMKVSMFVLVVALVACGGESPGDDQSCGGGAQVPMAERYHPLAVGKSWTYKVTKVGLPDEMKTQTVEAEEDVGGAKAGVTAFRLRTVKPDGQTVSWQEDDGACTVRHREQELAPAPSTTVLTDQVFVPYKVRLDETAAHLAVGASWTVTYTELSTDPTTGMTTSVAKSETWTVEAVNEMVTVPAGTFSCLRVRRIGQDIGQSDKTFWFAKGVGKVKETGDQTEELTAYQ